MLLYDHLPIQVLIPLRGEGGARRQAETIEREGVEVNQNAMGEYTIDFSVYGWFPQHLPSEAADLDENGDEEPGSRTAEK